MTLKMHLKMAILSPCTLILQAHLTINIP